MKKDKVKNRIKRKDCPFPEPPKNWLWENIDITSFAAALREARRPQSDLKKLEIDDKRAVDDTQIKWWNEADKNLPQKDVDKICEAIEEEVLRNRYRTREKRVKDMQKTYGKALWAKKSYIPDRVGWMPDDVLHHLMVETRFADVYNMLHRNMLLLEKDEIDGRIRAELGDTSFIETDGKRRTTPAFVLTNSDIYEQMMEELNRMSDKNIGKVTLVRYMRRFCELGILVRLQTAGKNRTYSVYAMGYWSFWTPKDVWRPIMLLKKDRPGIEALRNFRG